ncbi:MAG TPA: M3 family metallopeptidase [Candidatus Paceibacterota bacterium]
MSKKAKPAGKFSYRTTETLKPLKQNVLNWDLKKHYYKSDTDPQIELDAKSYEETMLAFSKKYKNKDFTATASSLLKALTEYEVLQGNALGSKVMRYFAFRTTVNVNDTAASKKMNLFAERFRKVSNEMVFFGLAIGRIPKAKQAEYLKDQSLAHFHYFLKASFEAAKHQLTEAEERILLLTGNTSHGMWEDGVEKIVSNRKITYKGKQYALPEALELIDLQNWADKNKLWNVILAELKQISEVVEHELTAIVTYDKVLDELRKYEKPYSGTVLSYENNEKSVEALVAAISSEGFALSKKFYKLKAKIHGLPTIPYINKYDSIGELKSIDYDASVEICRDTFYSLKPEYGQIFDMMLENGHIDVYPQTGKRGGAFMAATIGLPTFVMLNHTNNFKSLETLAHEVGHAIHAERSKIQSPMYESFSTTTAETASTLFEQFVLDRVFEQLSDEDKVTFLHNKISRDIATVQRQIAFFNFELDMHNHIRREGLATKEELAAMMARHLRAYLGPAVEVTEDDGYSYVYIPHIRYGFYVYTYTYGHLISNLMVQKYRHNPEYINKIDTFLTAGGSDTVENIFGKIGIDAKKIETFKESLATQAQEIALLEKLTRNRTKTK